jgi:flagellar assembly protein FliH
VASKSPVLPQKVEAGGVDQSRNSLEQTRIRELEGSVKLLERRVEDEKKTAREQGRQEGLAAGAQQESAKWADALARLGRSIEEMSKARARFRAEVEEDAVKLALVIARKVLNRELASDPEALVGLARVALGKLNLRDLQRVRVHPADTAAIDRLMAASAGPKRVEIVADNTLERGAAIFESERGTLDASVTTQLGEIERGLADLLGGPAK